MRNIFRRKCAFVRTLHVVLVILLLLPALPGNASPSQNTMLTGIVTSESDKQPLIGVSVQVKGTTRGSTTDTEGKYQLDVNKGEMVVFSYIGFTTREVRYDGQAVLNMALTEDTKSLEEVVVVGYGVQKKKLSTGATAQVKGDVLSNMNTTGAMQALQGQTAGVNITTTSGQPGKSMKVTVRGLGTVNNASPLYVVDGIQTSDISYLNNADIASIDVLKDAASAAIYGAQAANGVVLITTKSGQEGKAQVTFDGYFGVQRVSHKIRMLNADEYKLIMDEQALNEKKSAFDWESFNLGDVDTDWLDEMLVNNALTQNYVVGVQGGSKTSVYSMSLSYTAQEGIVGGKDVSDYKRFGYRANSEHKLYKDFLKVGQHMTLSFIKNRGIADGNQYNNSLRGAYGMSPFVPVYDADGNYWDNSNSLWNNGEGNPYGTMMLDNINRDSNQKFIGDVYAELNLWKGLRFRSTLGFDFYSKDSRSYKPTFKFSITDTSHGVSKVTQNMSKGYAYSIDNILSYYLNIKDSSLEAMLGQSARKYQGRSMWGTNNDLRTPGLDYAWLDNAENTVTTNKMYGGRPDVESALVSYFGRVGYNYKETYIVNATFRADGSSRFAKGHRWGYFPSVSAGWTMSNESFMRDTQNWLNYMKLRGSWGQVGNQNIGDFRYLSLISGGAIYNFGTQEGNDYNQIGYYPSSLANPDIKWETSEQLNFGFDSYFLNSRLSVNFDWYQKKTKDWLVSIPVLATSGITSKTINGGDVKNTGVELMVNWSDTFRGLTYSVGANMAYNKNKVGNIPTEDGIIHGKTNLLYNNSLEFYRAQNGHAIGYFWGYKTDGIFQNEQQIADWKAAGNGILQSEAKPGDVRYVDVNHDGVINEKDKVDLGHPTPDYTFGFNVSLEYKHFDLAVYANGVAGNKIVQSYRNQTDSKQNYTTAILGRWHGEGTSNRLPRVTESNINWQFSDLYVQKGDYLRIANITLGYDFAHLINCPNISQVRLYGQVQNPFTFTKYDGMDPEVGWSDDDFGSGIDLGMYPRAKTFLVGVNIKF